LGDVPMAEVVRVLAPLGVARIGGKRAVKPWPAAIDEWPQYLHGTDNNAVAQDTVVGPPRRLQWIADPMWSRSHMAIATVVALVSARGRLFSIEDTATAANPFLPGRFALIARDAFNGTVLWKRPFRDWEPVTRYIKDMAIQLQRRLAAIGDIVYCTPGLEAPLTAFDAATGKVIKVYEGTKLTQEFAVADGILYVVIGDRMNSARYNIVKAQASKGLNLGGADKEAPFGGTGFRGAYTPESADKEDPVCVIAAVQADSGAELWRTGDLHAYTGCSLAVRGQAAVYQTRGGLFCLDAKTGKPRWSAEKPIQGGDGTEANTVILADDRVYAQEGKKVCAYSLADGSLAWQAPIAQNYEKSADLFLAAGAVWTGGARQPTSLDPKTGAPLLTIKQRMNGPMGHDRCYRNFITARYYINSKTGGADFLTLDGKAEFPNHWTRGTCGLGVVPCNGLLYAPPYSCQCSAGAMIPGLNAFSTEPGLETPDQDIPIERKARWVKGPAFGTVGSPSNPTDWPTYRHDGTRGGATTAKVAAAPTLRWEAKLGTTPSAPVVAGGRVFVADVDAHTLVALDAATGAVAWSYVAGGRIDSPPTHHKGHLLFGSRDGWVHCLRAADGALAWRFKDLPDRLVGAFGQLESAWPVCGSVLALDDTAYFAAGRSSFLDGGIFLYGLDPATGKVKHSRQVYGPFAKDTGFPAVGHTGSRTDILVTDGKLLYMRHKAFNPDLADAGAPRPHVLPSAGFLEDNVQHRTYWTISARPLAFTAVRGASGDILVTDGKDCYEVRGFPVQRHSYFDPRLRGHKLVAGTIPPPRGPAPKAAGKKKRRGGGGAAAIPQSKWAADIPLTGRAMVLAGGTVFVAGMPMHFPPDHPVEKYEAAHAGKLGGVLWAAAAKDGKKLAEWKLKAAPAWDGMAAAGDSLFISLENGAVQCWR
ncbi:PQQ-binding-like beta-propeller repeat protein, partial [bacterium]|nr:PQQ-binding-like beta-propeller repeat protein [bacterium]